MENKLSQTDTDRIIEMAWEDRTTFTDINNQFGLKEKEVIKIMKDNLKRNSFLKWRQRVRGRKTKINSISGRFKSSIKRHNNMSSVQNISSEDCFKKLNEDQNSYLIDVRSPTEWNVDGIPDEDSFEGILFKLAIRNEEGTENLNFIEEFKSLEIPKDSNIYFICKSGGRSKLAANMVAIEGYKSLFNVEDGFTLGWKPKGLPSAEY